ncbi:hypothetical protein [Empedobacter brevis]|uniref:hypothetical protein n=1 Tax=Empedobacter brevis TaxID=247 RepID=UPI002FE1608A
MNRNNIFISLIFTFISCSEKYNDNNEYILDLPNYKPTLDEAVGKYYFVPIEDDFRNDYKYLNLTKGDTLFLEINKDSTYLFSKFYFNQGEYINNLKGKLIVDNSNVLLSPNLDVKNSKIYLLGFKKSEKTGLYYYYGINSPTDSTEFEYFLLFKKMINK